MELQECKLGDLIEVTRGASLAGEFYATEGNLIRLTCGNFDYNNNCFKENTSKDDIYFSGNVKPEFILEKGDIITPLTEQAIGLLGSTAIIPESGKYIQSQDVAKVTCKNGKIDKNFVFYLISSDTVKKQLSAGAQQTKIRHTSPDAIKGCKVFVPDLPNQKRIGSLLRTLDDKIALNQRINRNLEELARLIYDYWFVQFDFPDKNGKPYKTSGGKMVYNDQLKREIPAGWDVKRLGDVCNFRNGINYDKKEAGDKLYKIVNVRNISASSIILNQNDFDEITLNSKLADNYLIPENSILIARSGCPGATRIIIDVESNVIFCGFIICMDEFDAKYKLYYTLYLKGLENTSATKTGGSILQNVSQETLKRLPIVLPPEDVIASFNKKMHSIFSGQVLTNKEVVELTTLRARLLPLLMNGQVSVENMP